MVEDEPEIGVGDRDLHGRGQFSRRDLQVEGETGVRDVLQATLHVGAQQPLRVRLRRDVVPEGHQTLTARA